MPRQITDTAPAAAAPIVAARNAISLPNLNLEAAERLLCEQALTTAGSIVEAAFLLGCTRHSLKRRIIKHRIMWPKNSSVEVLPMQNA